VSVTPPERDWSRVDQAILVREAWAELFRIRAASFAGPRVPTPAGDEIRRRIRDDELSTDDDQDARDLAETRAFLALRNSVDGSAVLDAISGATGDNHHLAAEYDEGVH
jgi:hypothetical protein